MATYSGLFRLFVWHMKLSVSRAMTYRFDFVTNMFISILVSGIGPVIQYLYFTQTKGYPGWTLGEILLFQGLLLLWLGLRDMLLGGVRGAAVGMVWKGDFDRLLVKPYPPVGVLLASGFNLDGISSCIAGAAVTAAAMNQLGISLSFGTLLILIFLLLCGLVFFMAVTVFFCALVIFLVQMFAIGDILDRLLGFGDVPTNIFPAALRVLLVTLLPVAVWTYYPVQLLLNRGDNGMWIAALCSILLFIGSIKFWNRSLKHYTSAGG